MSFYYFCVTSWCWAILFLSSHALLVISGVLDKQHLICCQPRLDCVLRGPGLCWCCHHVLLSIACCFSQVLSSLHRLRRTAFARPHDRLRLRPLMVYGLLAGYSLCYSPRTGIIWGGHNLTLVATIRLKQEYCSTPTP